jgi:prolipoprotein diacylglyceryl transferase
VTRVTPGLRTAVACAPVNLAALPPLAEIPSPTHGVWHLGPLPIRAYALCIVLGILAACVVTEIRMRRRGAPPYAVLDVAVWAVPAGIIGARIYHVITSPDDYFGSGGNPLAALYIWKGGLGIWGAVAGGALGAWFACRRMGIPFSFVADAAAVGLPIAQAIGRWGNWFNNELFGGPTSLPWGLKVYEWNAETGSAQTDASGSPIEKGVFHPTFLYESLWCVGVAVLVWLVDRRYKLGRGRAFALYVMAYTVGRFWIELMRSDPAHSFLDLRVNGWVSILVFLGALLYFLRVRGPQQRLTVDEDGTVRVLPADAEAPAIGGTDEAVQPAEAVEAAERADDGTGDAERAVVEDDVDEEKSDAAPRP